MLMRWWIGSAVLGLSLGGAAFLVSTVDAQVPATNKAVLGAWGVDLSGMDRKVKPGDDFFRYVNGAWFDTAEIPPDRTTTGSFVQLDIQSETRVRGIMTELEGRAANLSPEEKQVRDLYTSYVDTDRLERLGLAPAQRDLAEIAAVKTHDDVARVMASPELGTESIFDVRIGVDDKNPDAYAIFARQSGLGLPDRDYYRLDEKGIVATREKYRAYIAEILRLGDIADADAKAEAIFKLESDIADIHWSRTERRDADKTYNPMRLSELVQFAPDFPWAETLRDSGIENPSTGERMVIVSEKSAFPGLASLFKRTSVDTWRDYLTFHYLSGHAALLPKRFDDARFEFYGKVLGGQREQLARDKRGVRFVGGMMGENVGRLYVARYFPADAKAKAQDLVRNLLAVYRQSVQTADWMSPETRRQALEKVGTFSVKIGYPDKWRDYSAFRVDPDDLLGNQARGARFEWNRRLARLDQPVDRSEWGMSPQTVNAYYNSSLNEIVFPAAILQPPFFDPNADPAVNYGGIGAVIGHEISHGFDDQGSKYDAEGVLRDWWTEADRKNFDTRTDALAEQFNGYSPIPGLNVNGRLTLGENIADLAGLTVSQAAYHLSLNGTTPPVLDGFTGDQRLFLGYAQVWRFKAREENIRQRVLSDPHSPPEFRINGIVRNVDAWYDAFDVMPGDKLYLAPAARVRLW
jgi:predicted metalloendopeptidase